MKSKINLLKSALIGLLFAICLTAQVPPRINGKIVFRSYDGENSEIYVMDQNGSDLTRLTFDTFWDGPPSFSPNGRMIAFLSTNSSGRRVIKVMNSDGSNIREVTDYGPWLATGNNIGWSPDSRTIVFQASMGRIFRVNIDGSERIQLTDGPCSPFGDMNPAWSPNGSTIAFFRDCGGSQSEIKLMHPDGSNLRSLLVHGFAEIEVNPDWSPDGSELLVISQISRCELPEGCVDAVQFNQYRQMIRTRIDGTIISSFTFPSYEGDTFGFAPKWSPDGTKVVYANSTSGIIYTRNIDGTGLRQLTTTGHNSNPSWQRLPETNARISGIVTSPDGRGLRNARITVTDSFGVVTTAATSSFGYYCFNDLFANESYTIQVTSKRYRFPVRIASTTENMTEINIVGDE